MVALSSGVGSLLWLPRQPLIQRPASQSLVSGWLWSEADVRAPFALPLCFGGSREPAPSRALWQEMAPDPLPT